MPSGPRRMPRMPVLTSVREYDGQPAICVSATQLGTRYTARQQTRIIAEWVEFFSSGPSPITDLEFVSRTPKRLFDSLASQVQLQRLKLKWGDYENLGTLAGMTELRTLLLRGAASVRDVVPLAGLHTVTELQLESVRHVRDLAPIGAMRALTRLDIGGDWISPRTAHVDSIAFLRHLPQLRELLLHTVIVDDLDYSPILALPNLTSVRVMKARGMQPSIEDLMAATPWSP